MRIEQKLIGNKTTKEVIIEFLSQSKIQITHVDELPIRKDGKPITPEQMYDIASTPGTTQEFDFIIEYFCEILLLDPNELAAIISALSTDETIVYLDNPN